MGAGVGVGRGVAVGARVGVGRGVAVGAATAVVAVGAAGIAVGVGAAGVGCAALPQATAARESSTIAAIAAARTIFRSSIIPLLTKVYPVNPDGGKMARA